MKKYKIQKSIITIFMVCALISAMILNASAAQVVFDDAAIVYLFPDGINVPITDFGVDVDTTQYVDINPYEYIPIEEGQIILTFNKGQMMWYQYEEVTDKYIKNVEPLIGYSSNDTGWPNTYLSLAVSYIEYDWSSAPNHFNVHFGIFDENGNEIVDDGFADGYVSEYPPREIWIFDTSQLKVYDNNPMLFYLVTQGMLFEDKAYGRGVVNGRQWTQVQLKEYYDEAFSAGYQQGIATIPANPTEKGLFGGLIRSVIMTPVEVVRDMLDFDVLGTNVSAFVFGVIGLAIIIAVMVTVIKLII